MARSTYIYVARCGARRESILATFTVKRELRTWLGEQTRDDLTITRHRDGHTSVGIIMLREEILASPA